MAQQQNSGSKLGATLGWLGGIIGFLGGLGAQDFPTGVVAGIALAVFGFLVGTVIEWVVARVLFVIFLLVALVLSPVGRLAFYAINEAMKSQGSS